MMLVNLSPEQLQTIREALEVRFNELDDIIRHGVYAEPMGIQETLVAIDSALAALDTPAEQWEPLPDENYDGMEISGNGSEIWLSTQDVHGVAWDVYHGLDDDLRLCRRKPQLRKEDV